MRALVMVGLGLLTAGCGGAGVEVNNQTPSRIENVVITARSASARIGRIDSKASGRTAVCPKGEAGSLGVAFTANSRTYHSEHQVYFECDWQYLVKITIAPDLGVEATAVLRP